MSTRPGLMDPPHEPTELAPGLIVAHRYRIVAKLGSGAMGAVFLAEHIELGRRVALKTIHHHLLGSPEAVARFEREALASARIDHPNVVAANDVVRLDDGSPVLVLEYVQGRSLAKRLTDDGPPPIGITVSLLEALSGALVEAHEAGIVHRDLKPDNLLLVERPGVPVTLKILDFGIAKLVGEAGATMAAGAPGTQLGLVYGTPRYMAPEQAIGQQVDARVDLYAVGVIAYELLSGHVPFDGDDLMAIVTKQLTKTPSPLPRHVPPALAAVVAKLLAPHANERFSSATELSAALRSIAAGMASSPSVDEMSTASFQAPLRASMQSAPIQPRAKRRGPLVVAAVAALVIMLATGWFIARRPGGRAQSPSTPSFSFTRETASDDELARAKSAGRSALEQLAFRFPNDGSVFVALVDASHAEGAPLLVAKYLTALAAMDPAAAASFGAIAETDAQKSDEAAAALVPLLANSLGDAGLDALVALADRKGPAKRKAVESLGDEAVRARLRPSSRVLVDARAAKTCAERKSLLPRLLENGDSRIAPHVTAWSAERGCGFLNLDDCNPCLRSKEARAQLTELRARVADAGPPARP
jgi:serine/threonine protein kinase